MDAHLGFAVTVDMHLCATTMAVVPLHMAAAVGGGRIEVVACNAMRFSRE